MYICHQCGYVSENTAYCSNPNCKSYGSANPQKRSLAQHDCSKPTQDFYKYEGDIDYPSDRQNVGEMPPNVLNYHAQNDTYLTANPMANMTKASPKSIGETKTSCGSLAFATVPKQSFESLFDPKQALKLGTIFPSLNMPYDKKILWRG